MQRQSEPTSPLDDLVENVVSKQQSIASDIEGQRIALADGTAEHKLLQGELIALQRAATGFGAARDDAVKARTAAQESRKSVQDALDELDDDAQARIIAAIQQIDEAIDSQRDAVSVAENKLAELTATVEAADTAVADSAAKVAATISSIRNLPGSILALIPQFKSLGTDILSAAGAGQNAKAFVLSCELIARSGTLDELISPQSTAALTEAYNSAKDALTADNKTRSEAKTAVTKQTATLNSARQQLVLLEGDRKNKLKGLYTSTRSASSGTAAH